MSTVGNHTNRKQSEQKEKQEKQITRWVSSDRWRNCTMRSHSLADRWLVSKWFLVSFNFLVFLHWFRVLNFPRDKHNPTKCRGVLSWYFSGLHFGYSQRTHRTHTLGAHLRCTHFFSVMSRFHSIPNKRKSLIIWFIQFFVSGILNTLAFLTTAKTMSNTKNSNNFGKQTDDDLNVTASSKNLKLRPK